MMPAYEKVSISTIIKVAKKWRNTCVKMKTLTVPLLDFLICKRKAFLRQKVLKKAHQMRRRRRRRPKGQIESFAI